MAEVEQLHSGNEGEEKGGRSTIEFPYMNMSDAIAVAQGIRDTTGSGVCQHDQLAAALSLSPKSSGYRMRLSAARLFGLIESASGGVKLTEAGHAVVDSTRSRQAKAKAFLNVPLFRAIYENNRGKQLPPNPALEREIEGLGVIPSMSERARQIFQRSAEVAGYFEMDRTRLIMPAGTDEAPPPKKDEDSPELKKNGAGSGGGEPPSGLHPFVQGLLKELPPAGSVWAEDQRKLWLDTASSIFKMIYKDDVMK
jgi:hypothetical protein